VRFLFVILVGCGGLVYSGDDAAIDAPFVDARSSDATVFRDGSDLDAPVFVDAPVTNDAGCTMQTIQLVLGSDGIQCKIGVKWWCNGTGYAIVDVPGPQNSSCDPGNDPNRGFRGTCIENGVVKSTFNSTDPQGCSCAVPAKLAAQVTKACGFPS
jgi:hypothetical protein